MVLIFTLDRTRSRVYIMPITTELAPRRPRGRDETMIMWVSNIPEASERLRAADAAYDAAMTACAGMKLADKIVAVRKARAARQDAYNAEFRMWETER